MARATYSLHRRRLKEYLDTSGAKTRVLKVLALFIESGTIYCVILVSGPLRTTYFVNGLADTFAAGRPGVPVQLRKFRHPRRCRVLFHLWMPRTHRGNASLNVRTCTCANIHLAGHISDRHHRPHRSQLLPARLGTIPPR